MGNVIMLVSTLDEASAFVVYASRIYRDRQCLCPVFHAAGMLDSVGSFVRFQAALAADPQGVELAASRGARTVSRGEHRLLAAFAFWQRWPCEPPEDALGFIGAPGLRRVAALAGRAFALELKRRGLVVRMTEIAPCPALPMERIAAMRMN